MKYNAYYNASSKQNARFNFWDLLALLVILALFSAFTWHTMMMTAPYQTGEALPLSLNPKYLPEYAIRTIVRMILALLLSLLFTFIVGTLAAKSEKAERFIIPTIDILQSIPVLSFLSLGVGGFIALFPGSLLGPECASIFVIFTSQAWNMAFGFYQSLKTIPSELKDVTQIFHLSRWQRFWRLEVPFAMPNLLWNIMMSMSASWFFVVASEAISVANYNIRLPGIGSYIALAIEKADIYSVGYAITCMLIVIILYDQLFFRPLIQWSEKFKFGPDASEETMNSWVMSLLKKTHLMKYWRYLFSYVTNAVIQIRFSRRQTQIPVKHPLSNRVYWSWVGFAALIFCVSLKVLMSYLLSTLTISEIFYAALLGFFTAARVTLLILLSSLLWVPVGVWIGLRPKIAYTLQPVIQFLASFPANLLFPLVVMLIVRYQLNIEIWTAPLMILGSQWYILFNVIAGTLAIPNDLHHATRNFGLKGLQWWTKFILPATFPFYITGAITAAGGAWNASIVAEWVNWGDKTLVAHGLGAYITEATLKGDPQRLVLGTGMMCLYVLIINRMVWRPLYQLAGTRFHHFSN